MVCASLAAPVPPAVAAAAAPALRTERGMKERIVERLTTAGRGAGVAVAGAAPINAPADAPAACCESSASGERDAPIVVKVESLHQKQASEESAQAQSMSTSNREFQAACRNGTAGGSCPFLRAHPPHFRVDSLRLLFVASAGGLGGCAPNSAATSSTARRGESAGRTRTRVRESLAVGQLPIACMQKHAHAREATDRRS